MVKQDWAKKGSINFTIFCEKVMSHLITAEKLKVMEHWNLHSLYPLRVLPKYLKESLVEFVWNYEEHRLAYQIWVWILGYIIQLGIKFDSEKLSEFSKNVSKINNTYMKLSGISIMFMPKFIWLLIQIQSKEENVVKLVLLFKG